MNIKRRNPFKKSKKDSDSIYLHEEFEKRFNDLKEKFEISLAELKENVAHGQSLGLIGSWTYDIEKNEMFRTEKVYNLLECRPQDLGSNLNNFYSHVHPDDLKIVKETKKKIMEGTEYDIQYRIITSDGVEKYIHEKTSVLLDIENKPVKVFGIMQDITQQKLIENHLKELGDHLNQAQMVAGIGSWKYDVLEDKFWGSPEMYGIYDIKPEDFITDYKNATKLIHPEDQDKALRAMEKHLAGESYEFEYRIPQKDGSLKYVVAKGVPTVDQEGRVVSIIGTIQDITEKKNLQIEIERQQEEIYKVQRRFQILVQESTDVFEIIDPDGTLKYISEASEKVFGYKSEEKIGKKIYNFYKDKQLHRLKKMIEVVIECPDKMVQDNLIFKDKSENDIYLDIQIKNLVHEPSIKGIVINFRDITKRIKMEQRMAYISTHDPLTALPNRTYLKKQLKNQYQLSKSIQSKFALMMLDIDGLKNIHYSLGYEIENQLILAIARRLKKFPYQDMFISRYSDDSFALIVKDLDTYEEYAYIAHMLIELFTTPYKIGKYELDVTANIGICIYPNSAEDVDSFIKNAKFTLFRAKKEGKNKFKFYNSELDIQNYKDYLMRAHLHHAMEKGELKVYYQPILNLKDHKILAAEALVRWEHPAWGMVMPGEFISLAEEIGLIIDIGKWVLREVCYNYQQWMNKKFPDIKVSVNFSSIQFFENNFVDNIKEIIDEFNLDPSFLIMEITEGIIIEQKEKAVEHIQRLQSFGIQIALDDFGTGFSSLAYLNSFNINILKLDRTFISDILSDEASNIITSSIIDMARKLKIKVVTEGIETWEQLYYLREQNCYAGQGFLYTKPIPLDQFERMLATGKCKPVVVNNSPVTPREDRRKFFRIQFSQLLEANITIKEIKGKKVNVGNTKVLIKNIGPGGLCFISNIKMPIKKHFIIQCVTELLEEEIKVYGHLVWTREIDPNIYEYGVEFIIDENERGKLIKILNQVQVKMKKDILFADGSFTPHSAKKYFDTSLIS